MNQSLKKQAENYDINALRKSLSKHDDNIQSLEDAIDRANEFIEQEQEMIQVINRDDNPADKKHIEIDTARLQDSISHHKSEIAVFESEINEEKARKNFTERLIMYKEVASGG